MAELTAAEKRGELLDAAEVERTWGGVLRTVCAGMLAVPSRIGAEADASHREGRVHELPKVAGIEMPDRGRHRKCGKLGRLVGHYEGSAARPMPSFQRLGTLNLIKWNAVFAG